jgi:hypothetical protein
MQLAAEVGSVPIQFIKLSKGNDI